MLVRMEHCKCLVSLFIWGALQRWAKKKSQNNGNSSKICSMVVLQSKRYAGRSLMKSRNKLQEQEVDQKSGFVVFYNFHLLFLYRSGCTADPTGTGAKYQRCFTMHTISKRTATCGGRVSNESYQHNTTIQKQPIPFALAL